MSRSRARRPRPLSRPPLAEVRHLTGLDVVAVNRSHGLWFLTLPDRRVVSLGAHPSASTIARALDAAGDHAASG